MLEPINKSAELTVNTDPMCDVCYFCDSPGDICKKCDAADWCLLSDT